MEHPGPISACEPASLVALLQEARRRTDAFFALLTPEALYQRAIAERHRVVFYIGHLEAFDWNLLAERCCGRPSLHPRFEQMFAFGIDPIIDRSDPGDRGDRGDVQAGAAAAVCLPQDGAADWPRLPEIRAYCDAARAVVDECVAALLPPAGLAADGRWLPVQMAIEHRLMHLETLAYMLPHLPLCSFVPAALATPPPTTPPPGYARSGAPGRVQTRAIAAGPATLGRPRGSGFGWDNEFAEQVIEVAPFTIDARSVTNGEYAEFVAAGGYDDPTLWQPADWRWRTASGLAQPLCWRRTDSGFLLRTAFAEVPLPFDWPAHVSLAEARAYVRFAARQRGRALRLMTEAEYHRAAYGVPGTRREQAVPFGELPPRPLHHGNFGCQSYEPSPVAAFPAGDSPFGVTDLVGNGWEWTDTPFAPLPGFQIDPRYPGYSQPFFDHQHYVLKGASMRTHTALLRRSFRNWFQPHYPYVLAKFRCAADDA